jgi:zinc protease
VPSVPADIAPQAPAVYVIDKPDLNQARVSIGLPSVRRDDPDVYALEVMNEILGGSGFSSRITRTVRSNEGLAYEAGSSLWFGAYYPGTFRAGLQSKSETTTRAITLVLAELQRMREGRVTPEELDAVKHNLIETFPSAFSSAAARVALWASDEYTGRPPSYWTTYRDRIAAVTAEDVQRVAREHLKAEQLRILVVGRVHDIEAPGPDAALQKLPLPVVRLGLPDPLTLQRPGP